jgi:hypothetical protein
MMSAPIVLRPANAVSRKITPLMISSHLTALVKGGKLNDIVLG